MLVTHFTIAVMKNIMQQPVSYCMINLSNILIIIVKVNLEVIY